MHQRAIELAPKFLWPHVHLVDAYVAAGKIEEAKAKAREILQMEPNFSTEKFFKKFVWYRDPGFLKRYITNIRSAGLR